MSVVIVVNDRIVYNRGIGWADLENHVPVTPDTLFASASTMKAITATAVLQLVERGTLDLHARIQRYCSAYPEKQWPVEILDLLRHQAGVPASTGAAVFSRDHFLTVNDAVAAFAKRELAFAPGTQVLYANDGYTLLACAIEGASGRSFNDYIRDNVLKPAGMRATQADDGYKTIPGRARSYVVRTESNTKTWEGLWTTAQLGAIPLNTPVNADPLDPTRNPGASGYVTNPTELSLFMHALLTKALLSEAMLSQMLSEQRTSDGKPTGRGLGFLVGPLLGERCVRVFGSDWSGSSAMLVLPERKFAVFISTNVEFEQPLSLATDLAKVWGFMQDGH